MDYLNRTEQDDVYYMQPNSFMGHDLYTSNNNNIGSDKAMQNMLCENKYI